MPGSASVSRGTLLCVTNLRQEPYAVTLHVRICAGGGQQWPSLPRPYFSVSLRAFDAASETGAVADPVVGSFESSPNAIPKSHSPDLLLVAGFAGGDSRTNPRPKLPRRPKATASCGRTAGDSAWRRLRCSTFRIGWPPSGRTPVPSPQARPVAARPPPECMRPACNSQLQTS